MPRGLRGAIRNPGALLRSAEHDLVRPVTDALTGANVRREIENAVSNAGQVTTQLGNTASAAIDNSSQSLVSLANTAKQTADATKEVVIKLCDQFEQLSKNVATTSNSAKQMIDNVSNRVDKLFDMMESLFKFFKYLGISAGVVVAAYVIYQYVAKPTLNSLFWSKPKLPQDKNDDVNSVDQSLTPKYQ